MEKETNTLNIIKALHAESKIIILIEIMDKCSTNVTNIVKHTKISRTNVSNHLTEMVDLNILKVEQKGRERHYEFNNDLREEVREMIKLMTEAYLTCPCLLGGHRKKGC